MKGFDRMKPLKKSILIDASPEKNRELLAANQVIKWSPNMAKWTQILLSVRALSSLSLGVFTEMQYPLSPASDHQKHL